VIGAVLTGNLSGKRNNAEAPLCARYLQNRL